MKHSIFLSIIACAASLSVAAQGSISDVVASVEQNNARLKATRARVSSDSIALRASNNLEDPRVAFEYNFGSKNIGDKWAIGVSQGFDWPTIYGERNRANNHRIDALSAAERAERADVILNTRLLCLDLIYTNRQIEAQDLILKNVDELYNLYNKAFEHGEASIIDINKIKIERIAAVQALDELKSKRNSLKEQLAGLNGNKPIEGVSLDALRDYPAEELAAIDAYRSLYATNNPQAEYFTHIDNSTRSDVKVARMGWLPKLELGYQYTNELGDGIGTICHEFSHVLGLMDEYDTDYSGSGGQSFDPEQWSVMANGADYNYGRTPASYSALQRMQAGFALPVEITEPGSYTLNVTYETNESYRIKSAVAKESFLFENRSLSTKWDKYLPGEGMMVYRVDSTSTSPWRNNTINCNPSHNYYEVVRARPNTTDMTSSAGDPFPGSGKVTKLTNSTTPANLLSWSGKKTPLVLSGITLDADGVIHFNVGEDYFGSVNEDFEEMTPGEAQSEGKFATWTFNNAKVVTCSSTKGNGAQSVEVAAGGEIIMSTVEAQLIEEIEFAGWNNSMKKSLLTISMSTDEGTTWTEIFARDSSTPTYMSSGVKGVRYAFVADAQGKAMFKISSSGKCYIDDVTISYNDPNGLSDVETIKVADKAAPFRVATNGNAISVTSDSNAAIEVYDAAGLLVARSASGNATIALPSRGFYIVRQGAASQKVAL